MIREDILQQFPELFGTKKVNGRDVNVEETIATLTRELRPAIAEALNARRALLGECRAGAEEIRLAEVGGDIRGSGHGTLLDISPDCPGHDRQLSGPRERMALASQRRSTHPRRRASVEQPRTGAYRPLASAGYGVQRFEQRRAHEHAGLRRRLALALPAPGHAQGPAGGNVCGPAERQRDSRGPLEPASHTKW